MNENYTVLPRKTKALLFDLSRIWEACHSDYAEYDRRVREKYLAAPSPELDDRLDTLCAARYIRDLSSWIPTDLGLEYHWLERRFLIYRHLIPATTALLVSLATNAIIRLFT